MFSVHLSDQTQHENTQHTMDIDDGSGHGGIAIAEQPTSARSRKIERSEKSFTVVTNWIADSSTHWSVPSLTTPSLYTRYDDVEAEKLAVQSKSPTRSANYDTYFWLRVYLLRLQKAVENPKANPKGKGKGKSKGKGKGKGKVKVKRETSPPPMNSKRLCSWTEEEDKTIIEMYFKLHTDKDIGEVLPGRNAHAITNRRRKLAHTEMWETISKDYFPPLVFNVNMNPADPLNKKPRAATDPSSSHTTAMGNLGSASKLEPGVTGKKRGGDDKDNISVKIEQDEMWFQHQGRSRNNWFAENRWRIADRGECMYKMHTWQLGTR